MIPEEVEFCEAIQQTPTGKIDRKMLFYRTETNK